MRSADNDGRFNVLIEPAEELVGFDLEIRPLCSDDADDHDYLPCRIRYISRLSISATI